MILFDIYNDNDERLHVNHFTKTIRDSYCQNIDLHTNEDSEICILLLTTVQQTAILRFQTHFF